jgi:hypothetical protein
LKQLLLVTFGLCAAFGQSAFGQFSTYGDVTTVTPGLGGGPAAFQLTSDPSGIGWGGLIFTPEGRFCWMKLRT